MERKIGEVFEYQGKKLKVVQTTRNLCHDCYFWDNVNCQKASRDCGECDEVKRTDHKSVIFMEVEDEPEEQQQEEPKLNLCEILKNCPEGTELWSDNYGKVRFLCIEDTFKPILTRRTDGLTASYTKEGWHRKDFPANCLLWPSRDCRDWSKFTAPWLKKERFDPKTLKPFDKIIFKGHGMWFCGLFSHIHNSYACVGETYHKCVIPYNDETKHLVGTTDEAPDFYRYWED